jgi:penicillin-binding protein 2
MVGRVSGMNLGRVMVIAALAAVVLGGDSWGQETVKPVVSSESAAKKDRDADDASFLTRKDARTLTLSIPAPRGVITDRFGEPLAQNKVAYYYGFQFPHFEKPEDVMVVNWARQRVEEIGKLTGQAWEVSDKRLLEHYRDRRWLPFTLSSVLTDEQVKAGTATLMSGVVLHPVYLRHYPEKSSMAHIIGYVRSKGKLPTGPINFGDPLFEETWGKEGLEKILDAELTGTPGQRKMIFDSDGTLKLDELEERPRVGNTVVTTLNLAWQKRAEQVLRDRCKRGAFVVLDIQTGEVLVLASRPSYDINVWIPTIGQEAFEKLRDDDSKPMYGRAFQAAYPPASTFKPIVALTALSNGVVRQRTLINCPARIKIGQTWFHNHSKIPEGEIAVERALARSNNVWFYQVGIRTRAQSFLSVAQRLGFGSVTGLPLFSENPGIIPTNALMKKELGRGITDGDTANFAIGQGALQGTPLQVAQAMMGIANGRVLTRLRLIRQIQDANGGVLMVPEPEMRNPLNVDPEAVEIVHQGMVDVVEAGHGTGQRASLSYTEMAGKTGTAQWTTDRELAWFAGFFPPENPRFAFAALYEGAPGELVSGGRKAAPMVPAFFEPLKDEIEPMIKPPSKALIIVEGGDSEGTEGVIEGEEGAGDSEGKPLEGVLDVLPVGPLETEIIPEFDPENPPPAAVIVEEDE